MATATSYPCSSSNCGGFYKPLEWSKCDTLGKKIGFIAGNCLQTAFNLAGKAGLHAAFNLAGRAFNATRACYSLLADSIVGKTIKIFFVTIKGSIAAGLNFANEFATKISTKIKECTLFIFSKIADAFNILNSKVLTPLFRLIISPIVNNIISPGVEKILSLCTSLFDKINEFSKKISTKFNKIAEIVAKIKIPPFIITIVQNALKEVVSSGMKIIRPLNTWIFSPLFSNVIKPILTIASDFFHGILSGVLSTEKTKSVKFQVAEEEFSKDSDEVSDSEEL